MKMSKKLSHSRKKLNALRKAISPEKNVPSSWECNKQIWDIVTALRGPDTNNGKVKSDFTALIRRFVLGINEVGITTNVGYTVAYASSEEEVYDRLVNNLANCFDPRFPVPNEVYLITKAGLTHKIHHTYQNITLHFAMHIVDACVAIGNILERTLIDDVYTALCNKKMAYDNLTPEERFLIIEDRQ